MATAFRPVVRIFDLGGIVGIPLLRFVFGDKMTDAATQTYLVYAILGLISARILISPYLVWREDQKKIEELKGALRHDDSEERKRLRAATAAMYSASDKAYRTLTVANDDAAKGIHAAWESALREFSDASNYFMTDEKIFRLSQDARHWCEVLGTSWGDKIGVNASGNALKACRSLQDAL